MCYDAVWHIINELGLFPLLAVGSNVNALLDETDKGKNPQF